MRTGEIAAVDIAAGQRPALPITGERTVPGVWHENYWISTTQRCARRDPEARSCERCALGYRHTVGAGALTLLPVTAKGPSATASVSSNAGTVPLTQLNFVTHVLGGSAPSVGYGRSGPDVAVSSAAFGSSPRSVLRFLSA